LTRIHWRASLVPAVAIIPAPIAYIKVVAVKKLVVGSQIRPDGPPTGGYCSLPIDNTSLSPLYLIPREGDLTSLNGWDWKGKRVRNHRCFPSGRSRVGFAGDAKCERLSKMKPNLKSPKKAPKIPSPVFRSR
ncbi:hypothetical protein AVEN_220910-1, partial [Araneus ventricosus]